jgi:DNA adenine methylase
MTLEEHQRLLDVLDAHRGPVVLSGYAHPLYDERLMHWQRLTSPAVAEYGRTRTEVLWLNRHAGHAQLAMWAQTAKEETDGK